MGNVYAFKFLHKEIFKMAVISCCWMSPTYFKPAVKKTWEETTLWSQTGVSRQKVGKIRRVREKTSAGHFSSPSIHTIVCMHIWPPVFFIISSLSLRGNTHSLRFVKYKVRKDWGRFSFKPGPHRLLFKLIEYLVLKTTCPFAVSYFKLIKA